MDIQEFFDKRFGNIRAFKNIDDTIWFVGVDIARALGYKRERDAINDRVRKEFKLRRQITDAGQKRTITVINEAGVYQLIFGSKLESAIQFQKWVFEEVLPAIRRHGAYVDANHKQFRELSKYIRKKESEAIGSLIHYGRKQGWLIDKIRLYAALTIYSQNDTCGIPIGGKDKASVQELYDLMCLETDIMVTILKGITDGEKYDKICISILDMINEFKQENFEDWTVIRYNSKNDVCYAQIEQKRKKIVVDTYDGETFEISLMK